MSYVDGFVAAVPNANREIYQRHTMPFDGKRVIYGGFEVVVNA